MQKLQTFFTTYFRSISEPEFYGQIYKKPLAFSLKYFYLFYFFVGIISGLVFWAKVLPEVKILSSEVIDIVDQEYPNDLVVDFNDSKLEYSGSQPYYHFSMPETLRDEEIENFNYLLTLDKNNLATNSSSLVVMGSDSVIIDQGDEDQVVPYSDIDISNFGLNRKDVDKFIPTLKENANNWLNYLPFLVTFVYWLLVPLAVLLMVGLYTIFIWLVINFYERSFTYKKLFQLGLHAVTFAETARLLQTLLFSGMNIPSVFSWAYLGAMLMGLYGVRKVKE